MKKSFFFFVFFIFITQLLKAQSNIYHPFPTANAIWTEYNNFSGIITKFQYAIFGDTTINNINYHKLYQQQIICQDSSISPANATLIGGLTEDSLKRIYFYNIAYNGPCVGSNQLYKIYDFSKQSIGDTIQFDNNVVPFCYNVPFLTISNIDSVLSNNNYRKRFHFAEGEIWMEGIGSMRHLLSLITPIPTCSCITELLCHKQNEVSYYINPAYNYCFCNLGVNSKSIAANETLFATPNPTQNNLRLNLTSPTINPYKIIDIFGRTVLLGTVTNINNQINIETLNEGFYILFVGSMVVKFEIIR